MLQSMELQKVRHDLALNTHTIECLRVKQPQMTMVAIHLHLKMPNKEGDLSSGYEST